jgi:hypothetical protein
VGSISPENLAQDFLLELAFAFGDRPRSEWPRDIPREWLKPNGEPRTILEAVKDITNRQHTSYVFIKDQNLRKLSFEIMGLPKIPECNRNNFEVDPQADPFLGHIPLPFIISNEEKVEFRRRLYNIWQVAMVLYENAPGSGVGYNGGLEILQKLFYRVAVSTPGAFQTSKPYANGRYNYDLNNLSVILRTVKMGAFRQVGRVLRYFEPQDVARYDRFTHELEQITRGELESVSVRYVPRLSDPQHPVFPKDPALSDFFNSLVRMAHTDNSPAVTRALLSYGRDRELFWTLMNEVFDAIDQGGDVLAGLKKTAFYGVANLNRLQPWDVAAKNFINAPETDLMHLLAYDILNILRKDGAFLVEHPELMRSLLTSKNTPRIMQNLHSFDWQEPMRSRTVDLLARLMKDYSQSIGSDRGERVSPILSGMEVLKVIYSNPELRDALDSLKPLADQVLDDPGYQALNMDEMLEGVADFISERGNYSSAQTAATS